MAKRASSREDIEILWFTDNIYSETRVDKNRCIYKRKDGTEYVAGWGNISRDAAGKPFVEHRCFTGRSMSVTDWLREIK